MQLHCFWQWNFRRQYIPSDLKNQVFPSDIISSLLFRCSFLCSIPRLPCHQCQTSCLGWTTSLNMVGHLTALVFQPLSPHVVSLLLSIRMEKVGYWAWFLSSSSFILFTHSTEVYWALTLWQYVTTAKLCARWWGSSCEHNEVPFLM